jgi:cytochrome b
MSIWDLPTRLFHWALVALVGTCAVTGFLLPEWSFGWHFIAGYGIAGLIVFRLVWAFGGPEHSRWPGFVPRPSAVLAHLKAMRSGQPPRFAGHNPAGGAMVAVLLLTLTGLVVSGLLTLGGQFKLGPLAFAIPFSLGSLAREGHELFANLLLGLVGLHLAGVVVESRLSAENLTKAMLTGRKDVPSGTTAAPRRRFAGLIALVLLGGGAIGGVTLAALPPLGWRPLTPPAAYAKECGACHIAYHPSLRPAAAWSAVMAGLPNHFGEDASLPPATAAAIEAWLTANAAETWDTQAANRLRRVDPAAPGQITKSPWWLHRHREIPEAVFKLPTVKSHGNCAACHKDAEQGRFTPQAISLPKGAR